MKAASLVSWPLHAAFARSPMSFVTGRGGAGALYPGFHALADRRHDPWRQQQRESKQPGLRNNISWNVGPRRLVVRFLNRIMLERSEVVKGEEGGLSATLGAADSRTAHVRGVLKAEDGESVRIGIVDAGRMDDALISWRNPIEPPEGAPPVDIPGRNKDRKAASTWGDLVLDLGSNDRLLEPVAQEQRPKIALMLAVPRPLQLERILPIVASLGVTTLVLCQARKVPKFYFGSHLFRDQSSMREKLIEGLSQCGDTTLPEIIVARRLTIFLEDDLDRLFPKERWVRAVAHPTRLPPQLGSSSGKEAVAEGGGLSAEPMTRQDNRNEVGAVARVPEPGLRFWELHPPNGCDPANAGLLIAIGPEGGWVEPDELGLLQSFGFKAVTLGSRVLRSDVAVTALLALAHAWREERAINRRPPSAQAPQ